jgi:acyl-CoA thioester hydrolase
MPDLEWSEAVRPEWIDYNGHLSEAYYVLVFGHASDAAMVVLGMTPEYLTQTRTSLFTLEAHVRYLDQIPPEAHLTVRSSVIGVTGKLLWSGTRCGATTGCGRPRRCSWCTSTRPRAGEPVPRRAAGARRGAAGAAPEHASRRIAVG